MLMKTISYFLEITLKDGFGQSPLQYSLVL